MTFKDIFRFWSPLASTWLMMSVEGPLIAAIIARQENPTFNLAAYGIAFAIALAVESPIINMLAAATALVRDRLSYFKLRSFTYMLNALITLVMLIAGVTPLFEAMATEVVGLPDEVAHLARISILILLPWPGAVGFRRFFQGVLIRGGQTRRVALGTFIRLIAMASSAFSLAAFTDLPGALVGATSLTIAVCVELLAVRWMASAVIRELRLDAKVREESRSMTFPSIARFYFPLALTAFLALAVQPSASFLAALGRRPVESLAVLPVIQSLVFIFRSLGLSFQEAAIALLGDKGENERVLGRFALLLGTSSTLMLCGLAFSPLATAWFEGVSGLSAELSAFAIGPTQIMALMPGLTVFLVWQRSLLVNRKRTSPITGASAAEILTVLTTMSLGLFVFDWTGAVAATTAFLLGRVAGCSYLELDRRRAQPVK